MNQKPTLKPTRRSAALMLAAGAGALIAATKPALWSAKLTTTATGAFVFGNPAAKVRLVEYFSYTCNHCADFAAQSAGEMKTLYLDKGLVAFEYRNLLRDPLDMTAALLVRCGGRQHFYANHRAIFASQAQWLDKAAKMTPEQMQPWYQGSFGERVRRIAADTGLDALMRQRGFTAAQLASAYDDKVALAEITGMSKLGQTRDQINATPSFMINDQLLAGVHSWSALKSRLDQAVRAS